MMDIFIKTLLKSLNIEEILARPDVLELINLIRQIALDHRENKERLIRIERYLRLDVKDGEAQLFPVHNPDQYRSDLTQEKKTDG